MKIYMFILFTSFNTSINLILKINIKKITFINYVIFKKLNLLK